MSSQSPQSPKLDDPKQLGARPDFPQRSIDPPGLEEEMSPRGDHGEDSYRGLGRLRERVALITGAFA